MYLVSHLWLCYTRSNNQKQVFDIQKIKYISMLQKESTIYDINDKT